jgi:hypothetical protein
VYRHALVFLFAAALVGSNLLAGCAGSSGVPTIRSVAQATATPKITGPAAWSQPTLPPSVGAPVATPFASPIPANNYGDFSIAALTTPNEGVFGPVYFTIATNCMSSTPTQFWDNFQMVPNQQIQFTFGVVQSGSCSSDTPTATLNFAIGQPATPSGYDGFAIFLQQANPAIGELFGIYQLYWSTSGIPNGFLANCIAVTDKNGNPVPPSPVSINTADRLNIAVTISYACLGG